MNYREKIKSIGKVLLTTSIFSCIEGASAAAVGGMFYHRNHLKTFRIFTLIQIGAIGNPIIALLATLFYIYPFFNLFKEFIEEGPSILLKKMTLEDFVKYFPIITCVSGMAIGKKVIGVQDDDEDVILAGIYGLTFNMSITLLYAVAKFSYDRRQNNDQERAHLLTV